MSTEEVLHISLNPEVTDGHSQAVPFQSRSAGASSNGVIYPKWIYIRERQGRYLTIRAGPSVGNLIFRSGEPDLDCAFEPIKFSTHHHLKDRFGKNFCLHHGYYGNPSYFYVTPNTLEDFDFSTIISRESKVYLKEVGTSATHIFCNEMTPTGAPIAHDFINQDSEMETIIAAAKNDIIDVEYDIPGAKVQEAAPLIALSTAVRNDSVGDVNQTLSYIYEKWAVGTWNNLNLGGR